MNHEGCQNDEKKDCVSFTGNLSSISDLRAASKSDHPSSSCSFETFLVQDLLSFEKHPANFEFSDIISPNPETEPDTLTLGLP